MGQNDFKTIYAFKIYVIRACLALALRFVVGEYTDTDTDTAAAATAMIIIYSTDLYINTCARASVVSILFKRLACGVVLTLCKNDFRETRTNTIIVIRRNRSPETRPRSICYPSRRSTVVADRTRGVRSCCQLIRFRIVDTAHTDQYIRDVNQFVSSLSLVFIPLAAGVASVPPAVFLIYTMHYTLSYRPCDNLRPLLLWPTSLPGLLLNLFHLSSSPRPVVVRSSLSTTKPSLALFPFSFFRHPSSLLYVRLLVCRSAATSVVLFPLSLRLARHYQSRI